MIQFCSLIARNKVGLAVDYSDNCRFLQQLTGEKPPPAAPVYLAPPPRQTANSNKPSFLAKLGFSLPPKIFASAPAALPDRASPASTNSLSIPRPFCYTIWPYRSRPRTCAAVIVSSSFVKSPEKSFQELLT
jgi:hypothetical protein